MDPITIKHVDARPRSKPKFEVCLGDRVIGSVEEFRAGRDTRFSAVLDLAAIDPHNLKADGRISGSGVDPMAAIDAAIEKARQTIASNTTALHLLEAHYGATPVDSDTAHAA